MKFIRQYDENSPVVTIELHRDVTLEEALDMFEKFLLACGYSFDGSVVIEDDING